VLAGGVNDANTDSDILAAAVRDVIAAVHSRAPGARIVVLGVPRVLLLDDEATADVDGVLLEVAGDAFITVRGWDISMSPDRIHPDDAGARAYAAEVAAVIDDLAPLAPS
jgi:hypothetical protein